jgi:CHAD domain-containing protein
LPEAAYRRTNSSLRDAGRPLGAVRDAKILIDAIDGLIGEVSGTATAGHLRTIRRTLAENGAETKRAVYTEPTGIALSRHTLQNVRQRIRNCSIAKHGWSTLGKGLSHAYRRGRRMYKKAHFKRRVQDLHEWRKQTKYLHHQLAVLKPLCKGPVGKLSAETAKLAEKLGADHDLAVLRTQICSSEAGIPPAAQAEIASLIEHERKRLQEAAFFLGARIYEEKPAHFSARFNRYWRQWRHSKRE